MISFATVYKTLKVLAEVDEIQKLKIAENKVNFDPNTEAHDHFYCRKCRGMKNIESIYMGSVRNAANPTNA